ncbi:MAG: hypothetical protein AABY19_00810, partial [Candidatus Thermoplasmatota archaeon]
MHTPRTVARRASFVVRLLFDEREGRFLVPGHRFFPFCRLDGPPNNLMLPVYGQRTAPVRQIAVARTTLSQATTLLDLDHQPDADDLHHAVLPWWVYSLRGFPRRGGLPSELEVRCDDYE